MHDFKSSEHKSRDARAFAKTPGMEGIRLIWAENTRKKSIIICLVRVIGVITSSRIFSSKRITDAIHPFFLFFRSASDTFSLSLFSILFRL